MTTIGTAASSGRPTPPEGLLVRTAIGFTAWAERWFPDAFIFVAIAVVVVALAALINGASPLRITFLWVDVKGRTNGGHYGIGRVRHWDLHLLASKAIAATKA